MRKDQDIFILKASRYSHASLPSVALGLTPSQIQGTSTENVKGMQVTWDVVN